MNGWGASGNGQVKGVTWSGVFSPADTKSSGDLARQRNVLLLKSEHDGMAVTHAHCPIHSAGKDGFTQRRPHANQLRVSLTGPDKGYCWIRDYVTHSHHTQTIVFV